VTSRLPLCTLLLVLVLAADNVKRVNDTYGHSGGDALLKALADTLVRNFPARATG
jgi:GGDEF domain-containing protein